LVEVVSRGTNREGRLEDETIDTAVDVWGNDSLRSSLYGKQIGFEIG
jgi:hypothetical protein